MAAITALLPPPPGVTIDTGFPGAVHDSATPRAKRSPKEAYALVRRNVDHLKHLLQLGVTLSGPGGSHPVVWQFNFRGFDERLDPHAPESIAMLKAHGMDFARLREDGIDPGDFADEFMRSGLNHRRPRRGRGAPEPLTWVAFSGSYDFAYLARMLFRQGSKGLPQKLEDFGRRVEKFFGPWVLDAKYIAKTCRIEDGGLEKVANTLGVQRRAGVAHNAGSDSLLTADVMLAIVLQLEGPPNYDYKVREKHAGKIDGLV
uniref:Putative CCR4-associated factor 1-11-like protein n=1 Tax=Aegilops tauschii TaxID=37682 RepID=M8C8M4_AEGTA